MNPYGYTVIHTSIAGGIFIISGLIGSFTVGFIIDRTQKYLFIYKILCICSFIVAIPFTWTLPEGKIYYLFPNIFLFGLFLLPVIPLGNGFSVELSFPVSEAMSNGWIIFWSQIIGFAFTYFGTYLCLIEPRWCILLYGSMILISIILNLFIHEDLKRFKHRK